jgi:hypothetical protein
MLPRRAGAEAAGRDARRHAHGAVCGSEGPRPGELAPLLAGVSRRPFDGAGTADMILPGGAARNVDGA